MPLIELSVSPDYVKWEIWPILRELIQNMQDANDKGFPRTVKYRPPNSKRGGVLVLRNDGVRLERKHLVFGGSEKDGDTTQRGKWGEGMKLAWTRLVRIGYHVSARSGLEKWVPEIGDSTTFGTEVLKVRATRIKELDAVVVEVRGVTELEWAQAKRNSLFLRDATAGSEVTCSGRILFDPKERGNVYGKGLFVCAREGAAYGYDLSNLDLDRDRKVPTDFSLKWDVAGLLSDQINNGAIDAAELLQAVLERKATFENEVLAFEHNMSCNALEKLACAFRDRYGGYSCPVTKNEEIETANHYGLNGVVVPDHLRLALERVMGTFGSRTENKKMDVVAEYSDEHLTETARENLRWARGIIELGLGGFDSSKIGAADFFGETILGLYRPTEAPPILIARRVLEDNTRDSILRTVVHEVAHMFAASGAEHANAEAEILTRAIVVLDEQGRRPLRAVQ